MNVKKRFSKDPKTAVISIEDFFSTFLSGPSFKQLWIGETPPEMGSTYYKFTPQYLLRIVYGYSITNFGLGCKEKLETIEVAYRDGKTEYELLDKTIGVLKEKATSSKANKAKNPPPVWLELWKDFLPEYQKNAAPLTKPFSSFLQNTGYQTSIEEYKNDYLVFDVETNGVRKANDDLLSLSIYDPTTGICYTRFFPLDLQPLILTEHIHGITDETLAEATHWTQEEVDWLIDFFHINDRVLLSYSGGDGTFDYAFVQNYCKRHGLRGFESVQLENIKDYVPFAPFEFEGQLTKDNLCKLFGIKGVRKKHSSYNDCILEWKLFEKLKPEHLFFINERLYKFSPKYIVPFSHLSACPELVSFADITLPHVKGTATELFRLKFPDNLLKQLKKFPTNITGVSIEQGINALIGAEKQDNSQFLYENKSHLEYVGSLKRNIKKIQITVDDNGLLKAVSKKDAKYIQGVNIVTKTILDYIKPLTDYLKSNVFEGDRIMTQELVISHDRKTLALCDLSDSKNVVEIKTKRVLSSQGDGTIVEDLATQLFLQANGRNTYVLSVMFDTHYGMSAEPIVDDLNIYLYKIDLSEYDPSTIVRTAALNELELNVLKELIDNPCVSKAELSRKTISSIKTIDWAIRFLERFGYIKKENPSAKKSAWLVLRKPEDSITKYTTDGNTIHII